MTKFEVEKKLSMKSTGKLISLSVNYDVNCALFHEVQTFIINTNRFSMATVWLFNYTFLAMLIYLL